MFNPISLYSFLFKKYLQTGNHPFKVRIQNLLGKHLFGKGISVVNNTGTRFCLLANDWITRTMLLNGEYEGESIKLSEKLLENGGIFIDIGANFGLYSCILSANKNVRVYAIEPNYIVVPALLQNVALNRRDNVTVLNAALSNDVQFVGFSLENPNNLGMASFEVKNNASFSVLSCPLKYIFESQKILTAELIKIDIEGNEFDVLKNFPFDKYEVKNILLEYNCLSKSSLQELADFFYLRGFIMQNIKGKQVNNILEGIPENNLWLVNRHLNHLH
jgi:FkbM family methyltransferase